MHAEYIKYIYHLPALQVDNMCAWEGSGCYTCSGRELGCPCNMDSQEDGSLLPTEHMRPGDAESQAACRAHIGDGVGEEWEGSWAVCAVYAVGESWGGAPMQLVAHGTMACTSYGPWDCSWHCI